jgi:Zn-dependent protease
VLFILNLLPFSPFDGWQAVLAVLPPRLAVWWQRNRQNGTFLLIGLVLLSLLAKDLIRFSGALKYLNLLDLFIVKPGTFIVWTLIG